MSGSFSDVRAAIESQVFAAYGAMVPPVEVIADNVQETPPALPYVQCLISYVTTTEPVICPGGSAMERLIGNLQLSCYAPRGRGMKPLEDMAAVGTKTMDKMHIDTTHARVRCGTVNGPTPVLTGSEPYALVTLSCSFDAKVGLGTHSFDLLTRDVELTNPARRKAKTGKANTKEVGLTQPVGGMTTQEDANQYFAERIEALEAGGGSGGGTDPDVIKRIEQLESTHDDHQGHDLKEY